MVGSEVKTRSDTVAVSTISVEEELVSSRKDVSLGRGVISVDVVSKISGSLSSCSTGSAWTNTGLHTEGAI